MQYIGAVTQIYAWRAKEQKENLCPLAAPERSPCKRITGCQDWPVIFIAERNTVGFEL